MLKKDIKNMRDEWHALLNEPEKFIAMLPEGGEKWTWIRIHNVRYSMDNDEF
jgi:hypothetical protein